MNEWLKNFFAQIKELWAKWGLVQKLILGGIVLAVIVGIAALLSVSSAPALAPVISTPITDELRREEIVTRLEKENVKVTVSGSGIVQVQDEKTARRMRDILFQEGLIPQGTDPWAVFDIQRYTTTDMERNVNLQRALTAELIAHIKALEDVDDARVEIVRPAKALFRAEQDPVSASVTIFPKPGSDIAANRKKIEGIQRLIQFAVEGLKEENIIISDNTGLQINDFSGMAAFDRIRQTEEELKLISKKEDEYRRKVIAALQQTFTADRVRDLNIKIGMDMSTETFQQHEIKPITIKERTPGLPYDDSEIKESLPVSEYRSSTAYEGTGYNPEGPAGVEGQTAPAFKDMSNLYGQVTQNIDQTNYEFSWKDTQGEKSPNWDRVSVSVNIDGTWKWKYDEKGKPALAVDGSIEREYTPVNPADIANTVRLIQDAIGYSAARGDSVSVTNIAYDRTAQFKAEDDAWRRQQQMQTTIIVFISGLLLLFLAFVIFRAVSRELERRRRLAEEERARREAAMRENALLQAEEEGMDVSISVEERTRLELQENVANMAKEHPEDVAQLIRTWLLED